MKLHSYLEALFGGRVAISIVRTLVAYAGKTFTVRELAKASGVSSSEAAVIVKQLEKNGIIQLKPVGRSYLVSLNEKSYALSEILVPAFNAERKTVEKLTALMQSRLDSGSILSAAIFGSVASGSEKDDSDIDLLVVADDLDAAAGAVAGVQEEVALVFGKKLSPLVMSKKEILSKRNDRLVRSIAGNHIHVVGKTLEEVFEN